MEDSMDRTDQTADTSDHYSYHDREWNEQQFQIAQANKHKQEDKEDSIELTKKTFSYIYTIQKWGMFLAICGFISAACLLFISLTVLIDKSFQQMNPLLGVFSLLYLLLGIAIVVMSIFLFRFSTQAKHGIDQKDPSIIESSFSQLKYFFAGSGWITIISVVLTIVAVIVGIIMGVAAAVAQAIE